MKNPRDAIAEALNRDAEERGAEPGEVEALLAQIDGLVQAARLSIDEPSEDATAALDAALDPWETE